jgi:hypothetical protein
LKISNTATGKLFGFLTLALCLLISGCGKKLDGVYHSGGGGPTVITLKGDKATVDIGGETKTLDYKVDGNKLTIINPAEGDINMTINDDGTLTGPFGTFSKSAS